MSYILCEDNGTMIGTYPDLASAQTSANSLATTYASGNPDMSVKNTSDFYTVVLFKSETREYSGISLVQTREDIVKAWTIKTLTSS